MIRERDTGQMWEVIELRNHLAVIKRVSDGLLRTVLADTTDYAHATAVELYSWWCEQNEPA